MSTGAGSGRAIKTSATRNAELPKNKSLSKAMFDDDAQQRLVPVGTILDYGGTTAPTGYLMCDGSQINRTSFSDLFTSIGTAHGTGNGTTTFHIPDLRGRVTRMVDGTASVDPDKASRLAMNTGGNTGNNVGSIQADDYVSHTHTQNSHSHTAGDNGHAHSYYICTGQASADPNGIPSTSAQAPFTSAATNTGYASVYVNANTASNQNSGGNETRMKNAYTNKIIKY